MTLTPKCDTVGCRRVSVHVLVVERILGIVKRVVRLCPGCYDEMKSVRPAAK